MGVLSRALIRPGVNLRLGAPPGVGDTYWVLTKLAAYRAHFRARTVMLCVQKTNLPRALEWATLVPDLVNVCSERRLQADRHCLSVGYSTSQPGMHAVLWPNGPIDRGEMLADWLPELGPPDLSFRMHTACPPGRERQVVVYVSSEGVNSAWCPNLGAFYWRSLIEQLGDLTGAPPLVIGKAWDASFGASVQGRCVNLIGHTSLVQVAGILESARVVVGVICGMTILANHFRTPCVAIHPVVPMNPRAWVAADAPYITVPAPEVPTPDALAPLAVSIMR